MAELDPVFAQHVKVRRHDAHDGDKKTAKELRTLINVAAQLTSCDGCTIHTAAKVMIAPRQILI